MRNSRAFGQALVAAVACVADDPPPPAGDRHGLSPESCVVGRFDRPTASRDRWVPAEPGSRFVYEETAGWPGSGPTLEAGPKASTVRVGWRATGARSRETHPVIRIALNAAALDRVRAGAMAMERAADQCSESVYGNSPTAVRAPPTPSTEPRRGDRP